MAEMAEKRTKKRRGNGFLWFMILYGVVFLAAIALGLRWFWGYMDAYEASRPHTAVNAYMDSLTTDKILENSKDILEQVDLRLQNEDYCLGYLRDALKGEITYARKASACTETEQTYVLRRGNQVIGSFVIATTPADRYGFTPWALREENFDLAYLMSGETLSVTVPSGFSVFVNGVELDESYISEENTRHYEVLEDFYGSYDLPELLMQTYQAGPFLGEPPTLEILDRDGQPFVMDENFDENVLISVKDEEEIRNLDEFTSDFLKSYVQFAGCANRNPEGNLKKILTYVVPESNLAQRMKKALDGLDFAQSRGDQLKDILIKHYIALPEGRWLLDVTYKVETMGRQGLYESTTNMKIMLVEIEGKLLVEAMTSY